jgi:hypothetical protein
MVRLVAAVAVLVLLWVEGARAQALETPLETAIGRNPDRFEATMLDLVAGFGGPEGLTREGIEEHVALERASARASAMRRLAAMDLNADGDVEREEMFVAQRAASAGARGRMARQFAAADADGDGRVTAAESAADARAEAMRALGEEEEAMLLSILTLDANGDDALGAEELRAAVARMADRT